MALVSTFQVGTFRCHALDGGRLWLDGGAMFGVVPRPLWERRIAPDDRNRIPLAMRPLLVEHDDGPVLIDTGLGNKESHKFREMYSVDNTGRSGPTRLEDALAEAGFSPGDVRWVINTHLHFDHAGGNTYVEGRSDGPADRRVDSVEITDRLTARPSAEITGRLTAHPSARLSFPNATYVVQRRELEFATRTNERTAASYLEHNFAPVGGAGRWRLADGETELLPGIRLVPTPGHVPYHQSVVIAQGGERACFLGDLVPTTAHVPLPWIMGYDLEPMVTLETKRSLLSRAEADGWILVFEHDPVHAAGRVVREGKSFAFSVLDTPSGAE